MQLVAAGRLRANAVAVLLSMIAAPGLTHSTRGDPPCVSSDCQGSSWLSCGMPAGYEQCWFRTDYILWQLDGENLPALVTASPAGTPLAQAGRLDDSSTTILSGNETVGNDFRSGFELSGGYWIDPFCGWGVAFDYFNAGRDSYNFADGPNSGQILARPFFNTQAGQQDAELVDVPSELVGSVTVRTFADFQGAGAGIEKRVWKCGNLCTCSSASVDVVAGYRYYQHDSQLNIDENLTVLPGTTSPLVPGTQILVSDRFSARNQFNGGEIGVHARMREDNFWLEGSALLAVGANDRVVFVNGASLTQVPGDTTVVSTGGLLATQPTNIGRYSDAHATVIPRFRLAAGVRLTDWLSAHFGYNLILWNDVAQAAEQLPTGLAVDPRNLPPVQAGGGPDPALPNIRGDRLAAHGFDIGLDLAF